MLSHIEREEIRQEIYNDLAQIEEDITLRAGSYTFLCLVAGDLIFTHSPIGRVIRHIEPHLEVA